MTVIVDAGSTKTEWVFIEAQQVVTRCMTVGINPYHQSKELIISIIDGELVPAIPTGCDSQVESLFFYGAGCATESVCKDLAALLSTYFTNASIEVYSDMFGAARALCGKKEGIACVLGTGSNSCLYDGEQIVDQIPSLGYILGDEGSSAYLGRRLLGDCFKRQLPEAVAEEFKQRYALTMEIVLEYVYKKPLPNKFMAGFTPFLQEKRTVPEVHSLLIDAFTNFFKRNVLKYHKPWLPVHFSGSISWFFKEEIAESAESLGLKVGTTMQSPMDGLIEFHTA